MFSTKSARHGVPPPSTGRRSRPLRRLRRLAAIVALSTMALAFVPAGTAAAADKGGIAPQATCRQHSQAWVKSFTYGILHSDLPGRTLTVHAGERLYHTGIVAPGTRIRFQYLNLDANTTFFVWSAPAGSNCVVPHEQSVLDTTIFSGTRWGVGALYVAWEDNQLRTPILGTLIVP